MAKLAASATPAVVMRARPAAWHGNRVGDPQAPRLLQIRPTTKPRRADPASPAAGRGRAAGPIIEWHNTPPGVRCHAITAP